jgi:hypothetical protein
VFSDAGIRSADSRLGCLDRVVGHEGEYAAWCCNSDRPSPRLTHDVATQDCNSEGIIL